MSTLFLVLLMYETMQSHFYYTVAICIGLIVWLAVERVVRHYMKLKAFANLASISKTSLEKRLTCTRGPGDAFGALRRHAVIFASCGQDDEIGYECWSKATDNGTRATLKDLQFLSTWCR